MRSRVACLLLVSMSFIVGGNRVEADVTPPKRIYDCQLRSIDGQPIEMAKYEGKVLLIVNVASECGMTPQYEGLQTLHQKYQAKGLAILGIPCNQFGGQEPGTDEEIKAFCTARYRVTFDLFSKIEVNGDKANPLYQFLTAAKAQPEGAGPIGWNFEKFLVDRGGKVIARFGSGVEPDSPELLDAIERALGNAKP